MALKICPGLRLKKVLSIGSLIAVVGVALFAFGPASDQVSADPAPYTFDVVADLDTIAVDGQCTLREAIGNINSGGGQPNLDCPVSGIHYSDFNGNNINTINLPEGPITLSSNLPTITGATNIIGQGQGKSVIDGNGQTVMFNINPPHNNTYSFEYSGFTLKNLAASGGNACLAFAAFEPVDIFVSNIDLEDCGTTGILLGADDWNAGQSATIEDVNITRTNINYPFSTSNYTFGIMVINFQTVAIDRASSRASFFGVYLHAGSKSSQQAEYSVSNTTLTDNALGLYAKAEGEYYDNYRAKLNLSLANNTITNNHQLEDQYIEGSDLNGGGLGFDALNTEHWGYPDTLNVTMQNNIIAGNGGYLSDGQPIARNCGIGSGTGSLTITSLGNNLSDNGCMDYLDSEDMLSSQISSTLGNFEDNGGSVKTMALLQGSPAINAGNTVTGLSTDARGVARPYGVAYDIGAFELNATDPLAEEPGPDDPGDPSSLGSIPAPPRTGRLAVAIMVTSIIFSLVVLLARTYQKKYHNPVSSR